MNNRRTFIKTLSTFFLGTWVPDWIPDEIVSVERDTAPAPVVNPVPRSTDHPELFDVPLREAFFRAVRETPPEYTRWMSVFGSNGLS